MCVCVLCVCVVCVLCVCCVCVCVCACVCACVCMCLQEQYLKGTCIRMSSHYVGLPLLLQPQMGVVSASIVDPALSLLRSLDLAVQHEGVWRGGG